MRTRRLPLACLVALGMLLGAPAAVFARQAGGTGVQAPDAPRAPGGPPLVGPGVSGEVAEPESDLSLPGDPLVQNGLGSPTCDYPPDGELDRATRRDCETSGFAASAAPSQNYGLDVHIDTGLLDLSSGGMLSLVQDLVVTPVWMMIVWVVHALVVMLEWAFSLDLLNSLSAAGVKSRLTGTLAGLGVPWLAFALAIAATIAAYDGLVRRRFAETLGELLLMAGMICGCLWLVGDPAGSIGALSRWSDQAGLGTLAVAARGSPTQADDALAGSMVGVFAATIEAPWCYLEFGAVAWCREPRLLDGSLRAAGLAIAAEQRQGTTSAMLDSARLLREARTNGALFLALPANDKYRNSINDTGSLLRVLCQSANATECHGAGASQAEFRTNAGTWPRVGGLLLIGIGLVGMLLLIGNIALRLLLAAILSLFYLLLAPAIVIAPAFGEPGRTVFRAWSLRLLGAVASKVLYAFLLGAVLAVTSMLDSLSALGWWTQWLLCSAFWWGLFLRRHRIAGEIARPGAGRARHGAAARQSFTHAIPRRAARSIGERRGRDRDRARLPPRTPVREPSRSTAARGNAPVDALVSRALRVASQGATRNATRPLRSRAARAQAQLERIRHSRTQAERDSEHRRALRLRVREQRVQTGIQETRERLLRESARPGKEQERAQAWSHFIDRQAALPRGAHAGRRDYASLAPLAGLDRSSYERSSPTAQRLARREIDDALAARPAGAGPLGPRPSGLTRKDGPGPHATPRRRTVSAPDRFGEQEESPIMRDIREVEAGRKRQLGIGRP